VVSGFLAAAMKTRRSSFVLAMPLFELCGRDQVYRSFLVRRWHLMGLQRFESVLNSKYGELIRVLVAVARTFPC
jgi:hypothetical protein